MRIVVRMSPSRESLSLGWRSAAPNRARNFFTGLAAGAIGGFLVGLSLGDDESCEFVCFSPVAVGAAMAVIGAPIGGVIGAVVNPGTNWETTAIGPVRTSIPRPSLKYSFRF
jgi:hypothetical protein